MQRVPDSLLGALKSEVTSDEATVSDKSLCILFKTTVRPSRETYLCLSNSFVQRKLTLRSYVKFRVVFVEFGSLLNDIC